MIKNLDDALEYMLGESTIENILMSVIDEGIRSNSQFQEKAGIDVTYERTTTGKCCDWCNSLAGAYNSESELPDGFWQRHDNCDCVVRFKGETVHDGAGGKRKYYKAKAGYNYEMTPEYKAKLAAERSKTAASRKAAAREKRIATWEKKKESRTIQTKNRLNKSGKDDRMSLRNNSFNSLGDPMVERMGPAMKSNPKELQRIKDYLQELGVKINESPNMGYGCTRLGVPGTISMPTDASISAWYHELQHACDDYIAGWDGAMALWDTDERIRREVRAYQIEIDIANKYGWSDLAEKLYNNLEEAIKGIRKNAEG